MAIYRNVHVSYWTDGKVVDDFSPEDRYFFVYLLTNPHTNLCGCYEISMKQMSDELGYNKETIEKLIDRFHSVHEVLAYSKKTKEMLLYNWWKYNWTKSPKLQAALLKEIPKVKTPKFRDYLNRILNEDTVSIPYEYGMDTPDTVTDTDSITVTGTEENEDGCQEERHKHGTNGWVLLTHEEYDRLVQDLGKEEAERCIAYVDESAQITSNKNKWKDWNLVVRKCHREKWGLPREPVKKERGTNGVAERGTEKDMSGAFGTWL